MTKREFIAQLREKLSGLPQADIEERVIFYSEMIDDRIEDGLSEEDAIAELGSIDEIASQIISDTPLSKIVKEKLKSKKRRKAGEIALIAIGSPIWFSLLIALIAVILSLYVSLWAVIISLWAAFASFIGGALMGVASGIILIISGSTHAGILLIGAAIALVGWAILMFFACRAATKGIIFLTKKITLFIKNCFVRKEEVQ